MCRELGESHIDSHRYQSIDYLAHALAALQTLHAKWWEDWFIRGTLIVLGFVFVAVGLGMFKPAQIIERMR